MTAPLDIFVMSEGAFLMLSLSAKRFQGLEERSSKKMKVLKKDGQIMEGKFEDKEVAQAFWHTTAHVLAQAVKRLYPQAKCAIGPAIAHGFYYDFSFDFSFTEEHLRAVEEEMKRIVKESLSLQVYDLTREEAAAFMEKQEEPYKLELIRELPEDERISFYRQGDYVEFCAGPHILNTSQIKALKLLSVAGAYWRGDENRPMLTRIYGISFPKASQLEEYLAMIEEAKARDHRKLGKELGLFAVLEEGPGFPFFLPKGMTLKNLLIDYWRELHRREGYQEISTPMMLERSLWETSGHWEHYRENMYTTVIDDVDFAVKPMNCPGGMLVYNMEPHSYKELPLRLGELGLVHRHEKSGQLHGLMRVRCFTQDDAHIFMTKEQILEEIKRVVLMIDEVYKKFGFAYHVELSTKPEDSIGSEEEWKLATEALESAVTSLGISYVVNEGDGAFYGPKLDFHLEDSIGRTWQCGTIQLDFQLPQRFGITYTGADGQKHQPIMLHRVIFGSIERFIGILTEHYAGKFPAWLSPVQVKVIPVSDRYLPYAESICTELEKQKIRTEIDRKNEKLGYKIREARLDKVPYMMVLGEKEQAGNTVSIRCRDGKEGGQDLGEMALEKFMEILKEAVSGDN